MLHMVNYQGNSRNLKLHCKVKRTKRIVAINIKSDKQQAIRVPESDKER